MNTLFFKSSTVLYAGALSFLLWVSCVDPAKTQAIICPSISPSVTSAKGPAISGWDSVTYSCTSPPPGPLVENRKPQDVPQCLGSEGTEERDRETGKELHKEEKEGSTRWLPLVRWLWACSYWKHQMKHNPQCQAGLNNYYQLLSTKCDSKGAV